MTTSATTSLPRALARSGIAAVVAAGLTTTCLAGAATAAQPSNWGGVDGGPGHARALTTTQLKAASIGSYKQAWKATLPPTTVQSCATPSTPTAYGDDVVVAAGSTLLQQQGPVVRAYAAATGAVKWTVDTRKTTADQASFWTLAATTDRVYVYQSSCGGTVRNGMVTVLDLATGAQVARRAGLGYGNRDTFSVSGGVVMTPEMALDASTLTKLWDLDKVDGFRPVLLAASSQVGIFLYGGDVKKTVQARRLSDGAILWQKADTLAGITRFSSDDASLVLQVGGRLDVLDPATGALRWSLAQADVQAVSASTVLVSRSDYRLERYNLDGTGLVAGPARAVPGYSSIAGKLVFDTTGAYLNGSAGVSVLQAATLAPVATLLPAQRVERVVPVGARLAVTPLTSGGLRTGDVVVLAAP